VVAASAVTVVATATPSAAASGTVSCVFFCAAAPAPAAAHLAKIKVLKVITFHGAHGGAGVHGGAGAHGRAGGHGLPVVVLPAEPDSPNVVLPGASDDSAFVLLDASGDAAVVLPSESEVPATLLPAQWAPTVFVLLETSAVPELSSVPTPTAAPTDAEELPDETAAPCPTACISALRAGVVCPCASGRLNCAAATAGPKVIDSGKIDVSDGSGADGKGAKAPSVPRPTACIPAVRDGFLCPCASGRLNCAAAVPVEEGAPDETGAPTPPRPTA